MPFGLRNVLETFELAMKIISAAVKWQYDLVYLNHVALFSQTPSQHIEQIANG